MTTPIDPFRRRQTGPLAFHLAEIAEEVHPVDLLNRVHTTSRRLSARRAVLTSGAAVAAVVIIAGSAWAALRPAGSAAPLPGTSTTAEPVVTASDEPSATPTTAPTAAPPTRSPAAKAATSARSTPSGAGPASYVLPDVSAWVKIPSELYAVNRGDTYDLAVIEGSRSRKIFSAPAGGGCGLSLSPDGRRVAWTTVDGSGPSGALVIARSDGGARRTVLRDVDCGGGRAPRWMPDSRHLLLYPADADAPVQVDVDSGKILTFPIKDAWDGYVAWSPSGSYVAYGTPTAGGTIVVAKPDGTVVHRIKHGDETPTGGFSVQGVSDDGRRVVLGFRNSDPQQVRDGFRVVDVVTGNNVALPSLVGATKSGSPVVYLMPDNQMLVRTDSGKLYLIGGGTVLDTRSLPAGTGSLAPTYL